jgi:hypothetical protein
VTRAAVGDHDVVRWTAHRTAAQLQARHVADISGSTFGYRYYTYRLGDRPVRPRSFRLLPLLAVEAGALSNCNIMLQFFSGASYCHVANADILGDRPIGSARVSLNRFGRPLSLGPIADTAVARGIGFSTVMSSLSQLTSSLGQLTELQTCLRAASNAASSASRSEK